MVLWKKEPKSCKSQNFIIGYRIQFTDSCKFYLSCSLSIYCLYLYLSLGLQSVENDLRWWQWAMDIAWVRGCLQQSSVLLFLPVSCSPSFSFFFFCWDWEWDFYFFCMFQLDPFVNQITYNHDPGCKRLVLWIKQLRMLYPGGTANLLTILLTSAKRYLLCGLPES